MALSRPVVTYQSVVYCQTEKQQNYRIQDRQRSSDRLAVVISAPHVWPLYTVSALPSAPVNFNHLSMRVPIRAIDARPGLRTLDSSDRSIDHTLESCLAKQLCSLKCLENCI